MICRGWPEWWSGWYWRWWWSWWTWLWPLWSINNRMVLCVKWPNFFGRCKNYFVKWEIFFGRGGAKITLASGKINSGGEVQKLFWQVGKLFCEVQKLFWQVGKFLWQVWSLADNPIQSERAKRSNSWIMECEEFILPDWSPPVNPIQSERAA